MHEGFRTALTKAVNDYGTRQNSQGRIPPGDDTSVKDLPQLFPLNFLTLSLG